MSLVTRRRMLGGLCSCSALALTACAIPSSTKAIAPGFHPQLDSDEGGLWQVMDKAEADIRASRALIRDPDLNAYVKDVVCRLSADHCPDIRTYILRVPAFNASAAPNGMLQVWSGLLLRTQNEAQLAAVLGHELGHYLRRHSLQQLRDTEAKANFGAFLGVGLAAGGLGIAAAATDLALLASIYGFTRDQEREADAIGFELMTKAGYRPIEAARMWEEIIAEEKADKHPRDRGFFFATHPDPEERAATLRQKAEQEKPDAGSTFVERYHTHIKGIRTMLIEDELRLRQFDRTLVVFNFLEESWPPDGELAYYRGEIYRLRDDSGDRKLALAAYDRALSLGNVPPELYRSVGLVRLKAGERDLARAAFEKYLQLRPNSSDGEMIRSYIHGQG